MGDVGALRVDHLGFLDVSKLERSESYERGSLGAGARVAPERLSGGGVESREEGS